LYAITENKPQCYITYLEFNGPADSNEVYTEPGIDVLDVSDNDSDNDSVDSCPQHTFRIPPKKILLT
jgi:hypothetical protein